MGSAFQTEAVTSLPKTVFFYKCPIGGFVSLRSGICPKCHEFLTPVVVVGDMDGHRGDGGNSNSGGGNDGVNVRGELVSMREGSEALTRCFVMQQVWKTKARALAALAAFAVALTLSQAPANAHGGEDHSVKKAPTVSTGTNMLVRAEHVGDLEVAIKHPPLEPDKELAARVFVTRFGTNEPIAGAKVVVVFTAAGGMPVEARAESSNTAGIYEVKFSPMPRGDYTLAARVEVGGTTPQAVEFGAIKVAPLPPAAAVDGSSRARTALFALGILAALGFLGLILYRATVQARRDRIKGEAAAA